MADIGQIDMEDWERRYGKEGAERMMKEVVKNNEEMIKMQKLIMELTMKMGEIKQQ